jgi:hypothetical protein
MQYLKAMAAEWSAFQRKGVFKYVWTTNGKRPIATRWVLNRKLLKDGSYFYKARCVVLGFLQRMGINFTETFAPTLSFNSVRVVVAVASHFGWDIVQLDIKTAFLNAEIDEEIYILPPPGINIPTGQHMLLQRSLYGLRQSPRRWNIKLTETLAKIGFRPIPSDECVFTTQDKQYILTAFVDDIFVTGRDKNTVIKIKDTIASFFQINDIGILSDSKYLSIQMSKNNSGIHLHQAPIIQQIVKDSGLQSAKSSLTPSPVTKIQAIMANKFSGSTHFRHFLGRINFLVTACRPDIAHAAMLCAKKAENPQLEDWLLLEGIIRYLAATPFLGPHYKKSQQSSSNSLSNHLHLVACCDASYASINFQNSVTGYCIYLSGSPVLWKSSVQGNVALSSCESELNSSVECLRQLLFVYNFLYDIRLAPPTPIRLFCDNQALVTLSANPSSSSKSHLRHVLPRLAFLREYINNKFLEMVWCKGKENPADVLTKLLDRQSHQWCIGSMFLP